MKLRALLLPCIDNLGVEAQFEHLAIYKIIGHIPESHMVYAIDNFGDKSIVSGFRFGLELKSRKKAALWNHRKDEGHRHAQWRSQAKSAWGAGTATADESTAPKLSSLYQLDGRMAKTIKHINDIEDCKILNYGVDGQEGSYYCDLHTSGVDYFKGLSIGECDAVRHFKASFDRVLAWAYNPSK